MFGISMWELMLVALLLFVLVGPKKLPEVAKTLAQAFVKLRRSVDEMKKEVDLDEELEFIKDVRSFSPERLLEDTEPKRPIEKVELPQGPSQKSPQQSRKKMISQGQNDSLNKRTKKKSKNTRQPENKKAKGGELSGLDSSEHRSTKKRNDEASIEKTPATQEHPAESGLGAGTVEKKENNQAFKAKKRVMIEPGKVD